MSNVLACPACGTEYESWSVKCLNCGVALVGMGEDVNPLDLPESQQVVYELGAWPLDLQTEAAAAMAESGITHAWEGTDLFVHLDDEDAVDEIMDRIEAAAGMVTPGSEGDEEPDDDEDDEDALAYTLDEWRPDERATLTAMLAERSIDHHWEDDVTLVVRADDEEAVEQVLDLVEFPDALPVDVVLPPEGAGDADPEVLSNLFLAADRLKGDPLDADGLSDLMAAVEVADPTVPPYGFDRRLWATIVEEAESLADLVADEVDHGDEVQAKAADLRALLRPYV
jgi:hypothetical protein